MKQLKELMIDLYELRLTFSRYLFSFFGNCLCCGKAFITQMRFVKCARDKNKTHLKKKLKHLLAQHKTNRLTAELEQQKNNVNMFCDLKDNILAFKK